MPENKTQKKHILNAHKNFEKPFRPHGLCLLASNLYSPSVPHPQTFIKTGLNIRRLLAVRLTSCDRVCCELKLIKLLLLQTDSNYTHAPFMPLTGRRAKTGRWI